VRLENELSLALVQENQAEQSRNDELKGACKDGIPRNVIIKGKIRGVEVNTGGVEVEPFCCEGNRREMCGGTVVALEADYAGNVTVGMTLQLLHYWVGV